jgi:hypothetical protein
MFFGGCKEALDYMHLACLVSDLGPVDGRTPAQLLETERKKGCLVKIDRMALVYFPNNVVAQCANGSTELTKVVADEHQLLSTYSTTVLGFPEFVTYFKSSK